MSPPTVKTSEFIPGYTVKERIGAGGYGDVWKAEAPGGLEKAVKFVYGYLDEERAARELKALGRIKEVRHPFLLSMERVEVIDGQLVIVMELADFSLKDRFEQCQQSGERGIPRDELLVYLGDAADALDYMSERYSLQHVDIKPENLLILGGRVKVADFGLVKDVHDTTVSMLGGLTPVYAPPEVFDGQPSLYSDQYSLAIVYQEMLTGVLPFPGRTASQLAVQHLHSPPRLAALPPSDQPIIARALSKDPQQRFPRCRALVDALLGRDNPASDGGAPANDEQLADPDPQSDTTALTCQVTQVAGRPASGPGREGGRRLSPEQEEGRSARELPDTSSCTQQFDRRKPPPPGRASSEGPGTGTPREPQLQSQVGPDRPIERAPFPLQQAPAPAKPLPPIEIGPEDCGLRPTLVVGIGGTAARALRRLRRRLRHRFGSPARVPAFRMLLVDTDCTTFADASRGDGAGAIGPGESITVPLRRPQDYRSQSKELLGWLSRRWLYNIPRSLQTEGLRPLGRLAFVDHAPELIERLRDAIASITAPNALAVSSANTGLKVRSDVPRVFVLSSISGGTGSGMVLDLGYAVRKVLRDLGLPDDGVCGILTHSSGRNPHERDLAVVNAYACLSELQHYGRNSQYPGDSASGLPAFPDKVAPFHDTYLVSLGTDLDEAQFQAAADALAEYLYLDTATAGGAFFDKCREMEHAHDGPAPADVPLRTFGIWHLGRSLSDVLAGAAEALSKQVIRGWRGDPDAGPVQPETPRSALPSDDGSPPQAPSEAGGIDPLASQWVDEHDLRREPLVKAAVQAIGVRLGDDPEAFFRQRLGRLLGETQRRGSGSESGAPGEKILAAIDAALGPREEPDGFQTDLQYALQAAVDKQLGEVGVGRPDDVCVWILRWVDSPGAGARAARQAGEWIAGHLRSLDAEICQEQQRIEGSLVEMERRLLSEQPPHQARPARRFGIGRRPKKTPSPEDQWLDYWRLRLCRVALPAVLRLVRSFAAQVSSVADLIKNLQRELGLIGNAFDESGFRAAPDVSRSVPPDPLEEIRNRVVHRISSQMPRLAAEVDRKIRAEFFEKNAGLCDILTQDHDLRQSLISALRHAARGVLREVLRKIDVTRLLLCPHHEWEGNEGLKGYLETATPELSTCGGVKRLLAVLPDGLEDASFRDAVKEHVTEGPSIVFDRDYDVVLCWEFDELPLSTVAATLIDCRIDHAQVASRLHTRIDVSWTSLAGF